MLLEEGADVNAPDTRGMTALHYAGMLIRNYIDTYCCITHAGSHI